MGCWQAGHCCGDRVQSERMSQISALHPCWRMQTALGRQLALDRDDQSPAVDHGGAHRVDRLSTVVLVSTPTLSNDEDGGGPGVQQAGPSSWSTAINGIQN